MSRASRLASAFACAIWAMLVGTAPGARHDTQVTAPPPRAEDPLTALEVRLDELNATLSQIIEGKGTATKLTRGRMGTKKCITLCPGLWSIMSWRMWSLKKAALDVITAATGTRPWFNIEDLQAVDPGAAIRYKETMRTVVHTFLEAADVSPYQRLVLILFSSPGFIGRKLTGLTVTSFCFFKEAWEEMKAEGKQPWATWTWSVLFAGCPPVGQPLPEPFDDGAKSEQLASSLALAFAGEAPEVPEQQRQHFESAPQYQGCVMKAVKRSKRWTRWELTVEKGHLMWKRSKKCGSGFFTSRLDGRVRTTSLALLTAKQGEDPVHFVETSAPAKSGSGRHLSSCIKMSNAWRNFIFCSDDGSSMEGAKSAIEGQLKIIGKETRAAIATSMELQRLILDKAGEEVKEELASVDNGDTDLELPEYEEEDSEEVKEELASVDTGDTDLELPEDEEEDGGEAAVPAEVAPVGLEQVVVELASFADDLDAAGQEVQAGASEEQDIANRVIQTVCSGRFPTQSTSSFVQEASAHAEGVQVSARGEFIPTVLATASTAVTIASVLNMVAACPGRACLGER